jgi:hypothetical protein
MLTGFFIAWISECRIISSLKRRDQALLRLHPFPVGHTPKAKRSPSRERPFLFYFNPDLIQVDQSAS